ncbi:MAG: GNAT family N-acetyltransferase [Spartobacteria bacterium]|nr:GNAT family N-acetyltransferase [Spartobacteria bacterium]
MTTPELDFLTATPDDVDILARHIRETSEGIVEQLLDNLFPDLTADDFLAMVLRESDTHFHTDNIALVKHQDTLIGLLFAYPASQHGIPEIMDRFLPPSRLDPVRAILTTSVPETIYINTIWTHPDWRGTGVADLLMEHARLLSEERGLRGLSLHVWRDNARALAFYARHGFREHQMIPAQAPLCARHPQGSFILTRGN